MDYWEAMGEALALRGLINNVQTRRELAQTLMLHYANILETNRHAAFAQRMDQAAREIKITAITGIVTLIGGAAVAAARSSGATIVSVSRTRALIDGLPAPQTALQRLTSFAMRWPSAGPLQGIVSRTSSFGMPGGIWEFAAFQMMRSMADWMARRTLEDNWKSIGFRESQALFSKHMQYTQRFYLQLDHQLRTLLAMEPKQLLKIDDALRAKVAEIIVRNHPKLSPAEESALAANSLQYVWLDIYRQLDLVYCRLQGQLTVLSRRLNAYRPGVGAELKGAAPGPRAGF